MVKKSIVDLAAAASADEGLLLLLLVLMAKAVVATKAQDKRRRKERKLHCPGCRGYFDIDTILDVTAFILFQCRWMEMSTPTKHIEVTNKCCDDA